MRLEVMNNTQEEEEDQRMLRRAREAPPARGTEWSGPHCNRLNACPACRALGSLCPSCPLSLQQLGFWDAAGLAHGLFWEIWMELFYLSPKNAEAG